ncbi:Uncharacterised protein [Mycobacteroides abscessus subsp. massiliense]|nr:Uncharacterised protein [Mycobacteroides abscessus subsp. massiliense]
MPAPVSTATVRAFAAAATSSSGTSTCFINQILTHTDRPRRKWAFSNYLAEKSSSMILIGRMVRSSRSHGAAQRA